MKNTSDIKDKLLDAAELMIQTRGYNAFSYADLEKLVKIRKASIHYHYPTKVDIALAVTRRYYDTFFTVLAVIDSKKISRIEKLRAYANLYTNQLIKGRFCLCGMLATDIGTLPKKLQSEVCKFFDDNVLWLEQILQKKEPETARMIIATLQGGMILVKSSGKISLYTSIIEELLTKLK